MDESKEPLVDPGMIQVALALTVIGYVLFEGSPAGTHVAGIVFVVSAFATALLYLVYLSEWLAKLEQRGIIPPRGKLFFPGSPLSRARTAEGAHFLLLAMMIALLLSVVFFV